MAVNTPYFITESSLKGFEKRHGGYNTLTLDGLPDRELIFALSAEEHPTKSLIDLVHQIFYFPLLLPALVLILIPAAVILVCRRRKKL